MQTIPTIPRPTPRNQGVRLRLAIDIDEVLAQHNRGLAEWHNEVYGTNHTAEDYFTDYWSKVWSVSPDEADRRALAFHASRAHSRFHPVPGAADALKKLSERYDLHIITVRRESIISDTREWVERHFPNIFDEMHFLHHWDKNDATSKAELCKRIRAVCLIDDSLRHCSLAARAGQSAILFGDYTWNRAQVLPSGVRRAKDWNEVVGMLL
jgi:5' nucleotidase, deoxy (Pyrimidine), cytosolic type C protein (NT5C).